MVAVRLLAVAHRMFMKRIVWLPGETVAFHEGRLLINGQPLAEPYVKFPCNWEQQPKQVGPNEYYVVGDNRDEVERKIAELQSLRAAESAPSANETTSGPQPLPTSSEAQAKAAAQIAVTPPATSTVDPGAREESTRKPHSAVTTRWWLWTAVGAVVAGTAVTVGILVRRDPTEIPASTLGAQKVLQ